MNNDLEALRWELAETRENLALILERKTEYVISTDVPLQLVKEERRLTRRIREIEQQIDQARPLELLRQATKSLTGPVARALDGMPWKGLKQQLLTQASKIPVHHHLDVAALERAADDLARLNREVALLLEAYRIGQNPGQLEAVKQHAALIGQHLLSIYQLSRGKAPELDWLVSQAQNTNEQEDKSEGHPEGTSASTG
jgi:hypothetical protein